MKNNTIKKPKSTTNQGFFSELGLSSGAESVYTVLIKRGASLVSDISKSTNQFRVDTYKYIEELMQHELVIQVKVGKRKKYEAVSPEIMYSILKKKETKVIEGVTEMCKIFDSKQKVFQIEVFSGKEGIGALYEILVKDAKKNAQLCRIESPQDYKKIKKYYPKLYWKRAGFRAGGDIEKFVITNPITMNTRQKNLNRFSKGVPQKYLPFNFNFTTLLIEDKIAIIDFELEKAILIKDQRFADYMKSIFWMLYGFLK